MSINFYMNGVVMKFENIGNKLLSFAKSSTITCSHCKKEVKKSAVEKSNYICPNCNLYFKMPAVSRIKSILDSYDVISKNPDIYDPINFPNYKEKQLDMRKKTDSMEAVLSAVGNIKDERVVVCVMDPNYFMGSMGSYVGEEISRTFIYAKENNLPVVVFSASGGARMQEGIYSLMQMAKTTMAVNEHSEAKLLYISCMTNPTTGGVIASFASIADIIISEPHAHLGFAGPRVIKQTIRQDLPEGFQSAEFLLEHGFLDDIVPRENLKEYIYTLIRLHKNVRTIN